MPQAWFRSMGALAFWALPLLASPQKPSEEMAGRVRLELTMEVATSTNEGYPAVLRVTIKNVGGETVSLPPLGHNCSPDNGIRVVLSWVSEDGTKGRGGGSGCGSGGSASLRNRVERGYLRLRPGEFMTVTESLLYRYDPSERGSVHYSVEYDPPSATETEIADLAAAGYVIPTQSIGTDEESFRVH